MKRTLFSITFALLSSTVLASGIPVIDGASISQNAQNQIETMLKWKLQYDQMVAQINQAEQQYKSLTGSRNLGQILNNPALRDYLPTEWQSVYDAVRRGGYNGLSGRGQTVYNDNKVFDMCANIKVSDDRKACEARAVKASQDKGFALDAFDAAKSRINQIDQLMQQINTTQDPKAIAELQGRIAAEQANIQNEQTKLQLYAMVAAAEEKVQQQRLREVQAKTWSSRKAMKVQPLNF